MVNIEKQLTVTIFLFGALTSVVHGRWFWESAEGKSLETWTAAKKIIFREKVRNLWMHAYSNYMFYGVCMPCIQNTLCLFSAFIYSAFPFDEVRTPA